MQTEWISRGDRMRLHADLALLAVTFVWGVTFVTVKNALQDIGVFYFLAIRFFIAGAFLAAVFWRRLLEIDLRVAKSGGLIGLFLFLGYAFQTAGLQYTTASNAGFITGLSVALVPCISALWMRRFPGMGTMAGACCAVIGLALLSLNATLTFNYGDVLVFFCAISFAFHIVCVGKYAPTFDAAHLAIIQICITALLSGVAAYSVEIPPLRMTGEVWTALAITAIPATALAFLVQNKMQQYTTPSRTAIIFSMEPVFAAFAGIFLLNESLTIQQMLGCILILAGTLISEFFPRSETKN